MALTRLPGSKWWIETDDVTSEIIGIYNKEQVTANIQAIRDTLLLYPDVSQDAADISAVLNLISKTNWTEARKKRVSNLVEEVYRTHQEDPRFLEGEQLRQRLEDEIALRNRLV